MIKRCLSSGFGFLVVINTIETLKAIAKVRAPDICPSAAETGRSVEVHSGQSERRTQSSPCSTVAVVGDKSGPAYSRWEARWGH